MSGTQPSRFVVGVDGGGTKTISVISDEQGQVLGYGRAGNCDIYVNPHAVDEVELAVARACAAANITAADLSAAAFSLCGCDWPEDFVFWDEALRERGLGTNMRIVNDAVGALSSDVPDGNAIVIICGTGAAIGSRNEHGDVWHSSFWQLRQGGSEMSHAALHLLYRAELGIDPPTSLTEPALRYFQMDSVGQLLHTFTGRDQKQPNYVAGLMPLIFDAADSGDLATRKLLEEYGTAYAEIAIAAARKVDIVGKPINLLLAGGVFRHPSQILRNRIIDVLHAAMPAITVVPSRSEPIKGAVTIALQMLGVTVDARIEQRVAETLPPPEFFHTHAPSHDAILEPSR
jgi:N-acetylglucosamine kinase-like BadF-type ATPase